MKLVPSDTFSRRLGFSLPALVRPKTSLHGFKPQQTAHLSPNFAHAFSLLRCRRPWGRQAVVLAPGRRFVCVSHDRYRLELVCHCFGTSRATKLWHKHGKHPILKIHCVRFRAVGVEDSRFVIVVLDAVSAPELVKLHV